MAILFKNAFLVHENEVVDFVFDHGVVKKRKPTHVGPFNQTIDLEKRMVLRGFSDTHMHLDKALIADKVVNHSGTLKEAISIMSTYKATMSDEDIYHRMKTIIDWAYANGTRFLRTNIDVDYKIGLRSLLILHQLRQTYQEKMVIESIAFPQEGFLSEPRNLTTLEDALKAGANVIGAIPAFDTNPRLHLEKVMALALKYNVDIDAHIDETDDPNSLTLKDLIELGHKNGYKGRLTAAHCCSLAANPHTIIDPILKDAKAMDISFVPLPSTNLYLQGRADRYNIRRGIAPIKKMIDEFNLNVAIGSDNVRDPFNPFGNAHPLQSALIAAHGAQMGGVDDFKALFNAVSKNGMHIMHCDYQIENAKFFIVVDSQTPSEAIIGLSPIYGYLENGKFIKK
jgi:cytosine/creatinine deaminase